MRRRKSISSKDTKIRMKKLLSSSQIMELNKTSNSIRSKKALNLKVAPRRRIWIESLTKTESQLKYRQIR
jgi:hypothetical protein